MLYIHTHTLNAHIHMHMHSDPGTGSTTTLNIPQDTVQAKRDRFRQQRQREIEIASLLKTTTFVENYLKNLSVWEFEDKEQNILTYEVLFMLFIECSKYACTWKYVALNLYRGGNYTCTCILRISQKRANFFNETCRKKTKCTCIRGTVGQCIMYL